MVLLSYIHVQVWRKHPVVAGGVFSHCIVSVDPNPY